jgi:hypothetical protein
MTTTIDPEIKVRLQELLSTKNQARNRLVKQKASDYSFCIEGIIGLAVGGVVYKNQECLFINGTPFTSILPPLNYKDKIPTEISIDLMLNNANILNLTDCQISYLKLFKEDGDKSLYWRSLNDTGGFTFKQFSILLNLI